MLVTLRYKLLSVSRAARRAARSALLALTFAGALSGAVVIDRIAAVVNQHPIKASDIDRDLRVTEFLNQEPLKLDTASRKKAGERLIDQEIIRTEIATGGYGRASDADVSSLLNSIRRDRFGGSDARIRQELSRYGLTEDALRAQLAWQLTVLKFIDERFRAGVLVTDQDVRNYYDAHRASYPKPFEAETAAIRTTLEGQQVNQQFETWLTAARKRAAVRYLEEGFQ
jgi:peptidyl-prolyl cis-trans isomerase SurA